MTINSISTVTTILLISLFVFCCKNADKTNNSKETPIKEDSNKVIKDSTEIKSDTISKSDTEKSNNAENNKPICYYCDDPIHDVYCKLNGKVKSIELTHYTDFIEKNGTILPNLESNYSQYLFQTHFTHDGKEDWTDMYRNSGGAYIYTYLYDSLDRASVKYMIYFGSDSTKIICSYDDKNNTKTEIYLNAENNSAINKYYYLYDNNNNLIMLKSFDENGYIYYKEEWKYDENNNIISYDRYSYKNNSLTNQTLSYYYYVFDKNNNWTMQYDYNQDKELKSITVRTITYY